jgi:D-alanine-D-alanine ligase
MSPNKYGKVAVLLGGESNEREISIQSGKAVFEALQSCKIDCFLIDPKIDSLDLIKKSDRAFICLHGRDGEDGKIQTYLDKINIPYTGSDAKSSKLGMDKFLSKSLWNSKGVKTPAFIKIDSEKSFKYVEQKLKLPFFLKPANSGSSLGISKIFNESQFYESFNEAYKIDSMVIGEAMVDGREFTIPILNNIPLSILEIRTRTDFYDYEAKYLRDDTEFVRPTDLNESLISTINKLSIESFNLLGCSGWGRVDLMIDNNGNIFIIEVNTIPGMTSHSLVPLSASYSGISFKDLVLSILDTSYA